MRVVLPISTGMGILKVTQENCIWNKTVRLMLSYHHSLKHLTPEHCHCQWRTPNLISPTPQQHRVPEAKRKQWLLVATMIMNAKLLTAAPFFCTPFMSVPRVVAPITPPSIPAHILVQSFSSTAHYKLRYTHFTSYCMLIPLPFRALLHCNFKM